MRVNDRGPYVKDRIIDLSKRGAQLLGYMGQGTTRVKVEVLPKESKALKEALLNLSSAKGKSVQSAPVRLKLLKIAVYTALQLKIRKKAIPEL